MSLQHRSCSDSRVFLPSEAGKSFFGGLMGLLLPFRENSVQGAEWSPVRETTPLVRTEGVEVVTSAFLLKPFLIWKFKKKVTTKVKEFAIGFTFWHLKVWFRHYLAMWKTTRLLISCNRDNEREKDIYCSLWSLERFDHHHAATERATTSNVKVKL